MMQLEHLRAVLTYVGEKTSPIARDELLAIIAAYSVDGFELTLREGFIVDAETDLDLTPEQFIRAIKAMRKREGRYLRAGKLNGQIVALSDEMTDSSK